MKWFVHVAADYYNHSCVIEADSAEEAFLSAVEQNWGDSYGDGDSPACAVMPYDKVLFFGHENRVRALMEGEDD